MPKIFGTDGIRGQFGKYPITENFFSEFSLIIECFFKTFLNKSNLKIAIGRDTRESGKVLYNAIIKWLSSDVTILDCGIIPTPAISKVINAEKCDYGFVITASHNIFSDNGLKIFNNKGEKLPLNVEQAIENFENIAKEQPSTPTIINYQSEALNLFNSQFDDINFYIDDTIVLDIANGAATYTSPYILKKFCKNLVVVGNQPDGKNINVDCGTEHVDNLIKAVKKHQACVGIAHDGDADRLIMVDETGTILTGDEIIGILAKNLKKKKELKNDTVVVTEQSNSGLDETLKYDNIKVIRSDVGDRNVYYSMLEHDSILGGEESGHIILRQFSNTGNAISAAICVLQILAESADKLSILKQQIKLFPKKSLNLNVQNKIPLNELQEVNTLLDNLKNTNADYMRVLIRYSGTENKLRILVEAKTEVMAGKILFSVQDCVKKEFCKLGIQVA